MRLNVGIFLPAFETFDATLCASRMDWLPCSFENVREEIFPELCFLSRFRWHKPMLVAQCILFDISACSEWKGKTWPRSSRGCFVIVAELHLTGLSLSTRLLSTRSAWVCVVDYFIGSIDRLVWSRLLMHPFLSSVAAALCVRL